jgi:hypothetical protein
LEFTLQRVRDLHKLKLELQPTMPRYGAGIRRLFPQIAKMPQILFFTICENPQNLRTLFPKQFLPCVR